MIHKQINVQFLDDSVVERCGKILKKKELSVNPAKIDENTVHIYEEKKIKIRYL